jgi:hypothetical protein
MSAGALWLEASWISLPINGKMTARCVFVLFASVHAHCRASCNDFSFAIGRRKATAGLVSMSVGVSFCICLRAGHFLSPLCLLFGSLGKQGQDGMDRRQVAVSYGLYRAALCSISFDSQKESLQMISNFKSASNACGSSNIQQGSGENPSRLSVGAQDRGLADAGTPR